MDMYMRRKCQECRLKKCKAVGMLAECECQNYFSLVSDVLLSLGTFLISCISWNRIN